MAYKQTPTPKALRSNSKVPTPIKIAPSPNAVIYANILATRAQFAKYGTIANAPADRVPPRKHIMTGPNGTHRQ